MTTRRNFLKVITAAAIAPTMPLAVIPAKEYSTIYGVSLFQSTGVSHFTAKGILKHLDGTITLKNETDLEIKRGSLVYLTKIQAGKEKAWLDTASYMRGGDESEWDMPDDEATSSEQSLVQKTRKIQEELAHDKAMGYRS